MSTQASLELVAGEPYSARITVTDGKDVWATADLFEVRSQARRYQAETSTLIADFTPSLTKGYTANDIVITLTLTGEQTRQIAGKSGFYDMFISDVGLTDAKAFRILYGPLSVANAVTSAS